MRTVSVNDIPSYIDSNKLQELFPDNFVSACKYVLFVFDSDDDIILCLQVLYSKNWPQHLYGTSMNRDHGIALWSDGRTGITHHPRNWNIDKALLMVPGTAYDDEGKFGASYSADELKKLNCDGRKSCAACGGELKELAMGFINLNYCPICEG